MGLPYCDVRKFSIIDGLAANTISDIAQTPDRLMWFSTWNGISYYDGNYHGLDHKKYQIEIHPVRKVEEAFRCLFG